jgi:hypothetical protein
LFLKVLSLLSSKISKRIIIVLLIVALGALMAARKQFITKNMGSWEHSTLESQERNLGHVHPLFSKHAYTPPIYTWIPYALHDSKIFHVFSAVFYWVLVIALVFLIVHQTGFDNYFSIVLTMLVLFVAGVAAKEIFGIQMIGPAPNFGYQNFDWRIFIAPLSLGSILLAFRSRLIFSGVMIGLTSIIHLKYGLRVFVLMIGCMVLWNLWGYHWVKKPQLKIAWRSVVGFGCIWFVLFTTMLLYSLNSLSWFATLDVPKVATPFISRLGWIIKNEPDDYMISYYLNSGIPFFGFIFLAISTIILCELIRRDIHDTRLKTMVVILMFSVFIALSLFSLGFLFETFLIDHLPLNLSTMLILARAWDLIWVVPIAFTIAIFLYFFLWAEDLGRRFKIRHFAIRKIFLHVVCVGFVLLNLYIFANKKDISIFRETNTEDRNFSYTQICTEDTALYKETLERLWILADRKKEDKFYKKLQILENIFDRTLKPAKVEETNNPDVKNLKILYNFKSNRYRLASQELLKVGTPEKSHHLYLWSCDNKKAGIHRVFVENSFLDFHNVSQWINKNTPIDRGVINPPYMSKLSVYSRRVDFWDLKRDGHPMGQAKEYYPIGLHRLQTLAGPYAVKMAPGIRYGMVGLRGRAYFLSLQEKDFLKIKKNYPNYDYLVTENFTLPGFSMIYSNNSYAVYDISKKNKVS